MTKKGLFILLLVGLVLSLAAPMIQAQSQEPFRSIRGSVREDTDGDGKCDTGAAVVGVPIEFISNDGQWTHVLYTGDDGSYGLVSVGLGTWTVTAKPPAEWVVTSAKVLKPFISDTAPVALNVNFCVRKAAAVAQPGTTVLPQSGAGMPTPLVVGLVGGVMFLLTGVMLEGRRRWSIRIYD